MVINPISPKKHSTFVKFPQVLCKECCCRFRLNQELIPNRWTIPNQYFIFFTFVTDLKHFKGTIFNFTTDIFENILKTTLNFQIFLRLLLVNSECYCGFQFNHKCKETIFNVILHIFENVLKCLEFSCTRMRLCFNSVQNIAVARIEVLFEFGIYI